MMAEQTHYEYCGQLFPSYVTRVEEKTAKRTLAKIGDGDDWFRIRYKNM